MNTSEGITHLGDFNYNVYIGYVLSLLICFACIAKGVKVSGRITVYTGTLPYLFLIILILRGIFLPGALEGLYYAFKPDFSKIFEF